MTNATNYVTLAIQRQPFTDKAQMDEAIKLHLAEHGRDLSDTAVEILRLLSRYACKYPGVAFLKNKTIAAAIGKSRLTVIRNITKLVNAGIIEKVGVMRAINGGNGANMYVIQSTPRGEVSESRGSDVGTTVTPQPIHRQQPAEPTAATVSLTNGGNEPSLYFKQDLSISYTYKEQRLQPPYRRFKSYVEQFIGNGNKALVSRLYGVYLAQTTALSKTDSYDQETLLDIGLRALGVTFSASKQQTLRNIPGYFNGVIDRMLDALYDEGMSAFHSEG